MYFKSKNRKVVSLKHSLFEAKKLEVIVQLDEDPIDDCSGNKWWKLKYNLLEAKKKNYSTILTFGGAYSNHILATSKAAKEMGFESIGVIRGHELDGNNPTLQRAKLNGMKFHFVDRSTYRDKENINWNEIFKKSSKPFLHDDLLFKPVKPNLEVPVEQSKLYLESGNSLAPLEIRELKNTGDSKIYNAEARKKIIHDMSNQIFKVLGNGEIGRNRVKPENIAILVRSNPQALE